jgi:hypothetical protein
LIIIGYVAGKKDGDEHKSKDFLAEREILIASQKKKWSRHLPRQLLSDDKRQVMCQFYFLLAASAQPAQGGANSVAL